VSMGLAAVLGEAVGLRTMYVISGLILLSAGVVGLLVLKEPETAVEEPAVDRSAKAAEVVAD